MGKTRRGGRRKSRKGGRTRTRRGGMINTIIHALKEALPSYLLYQAVKVQQGRKKRGGRKTRMTSQTLSNAKSH